MNSSKRGAVYGFKLQSLDLVSLQSSAIYIFREFSHIDVLNQLWCVFLFDTDSFEHHTRVWIQTIGSRV